MAVVVTDVEVGRTALAFTTMIPVLFIKGTNGVNVFLIHMAML